MCCARPTRVPGRRRLRTTIDRVQPPSRPSWDHADPGVRPLRARRPRRRPRDRRLSSLVGHRRPDRLARTGPAARTTFLSGLSQWKGAPVIQQRPTRRPRTAGAKVAARLRRRTWGWSVFRKASPVRASLIAIGTIAIVAGVVLISAGLNIITITRMSGNTTWAIVGPIVAVVGMLVLLFAIRRPDPD